MVKVRLRGIGRRVESKPWGGDIAKQAALEYLKVRLKQATDSHHCASRVMTEMGSDPFGYVPVEYSRWLEMADESGRLIWALRQLIAEFDSPVQTPRAEPPL